LIGFNAAFEQLIKDLSEFEATDSDTTEVKTIEIKTPTGKLFSISLNSNNNLSLYTGLNKQKNGSITKENILAQINGEDWNGYLEGICNYLKENYNYSSTTENAAKNFVLIIDEINRGNVSQIFGELITLIEDDKRIGCPEALEVTLPYSKEKFGVPSNLYIIGTMNTADRSVEALDAALRRRFSFEEMPPKPDLIRTEGKLSKTEGILELDKFDDIDLPLLLNKINERLEKLLDKDHQIGHSYFINVEDLEGLKLAFKNKIIPLLQEYFFGDYGKIGLVLGEGFVEKEPLKESIFAYFPDADADDFSDRPIFKIKKLTSDDDFINAIEFLLSNKKTNG
jgi:5-methylcytosine-specific restriction endonuclease McrBC GTP-binding regulatory subunit McrB